MVNGHTLTDAERLAVNHVQDWLRSFGGDSCTEPNCSPVGNGRWVPLTDIFPRRPGRGMPGLAGSAAARTNAMRQAIRRLHEKGVLLAYEIAYYGDCVKAVRAEQVAEVEKAIAAMSPQERELAVHG